MHGVRHEERDKERRRARGNVTPQLAMVKKPEISSTVIVRRQFGSRLTFENLYQPKSATSEPSGRLSAAMPVAVCCSVSQCGAEWCSVVQCLALFAVYCSALQCVAD